MSLEIKKMLDSMESMANQRQLGFAVVVKAVESALAYVFEKSDKSDQARGCHYRVAIDSQTGAYECFRYWRIVSDEDFDVMSQAPDSSEGSKDHFNLGVMSLSQASSWGDDLNIDDTVEEQVEAEPLGRIAAQQAKQFILQRLREAEREMLCREYSQRINQIIMGTVKRVTRDSLIIELGNNAEALLQRSEMIPRENFRLGDRVKAVLFAVNDDKRGPQLLVSRKHPQFLIELFKIEVPEINEEVIEIIAAVRDAGSRAKICVKTNDGRVDPVGACVGMRGSRVQAVSNELSGERVDIILWDDNPAQLVIKAMAPAEVSSIVVDEDRHSMDVIVEENQLSLAIGRGGQNVRLAGELCGWTLNVLSKEDAQKQQDSEKTAAVASLVEALGLDEGLGQRLYAKDIRTVEEFAYADPELLLTIKGISEAVLEALLQQAGDILLTKELLGEESSSEDAYDPTGGPLDQLEGMTQDWLVALSGHGIATRDDLGDLSIDELQEMISIEKEAASLLIMKARAHWFSDTDVINS